MKKVHNQAIRDPQSILSYFRSERFSLAIVTVTGIIYNIGLLAGPWYEGQMTQALIDVFNHEKTSSDVIRLVIAYILVVSVVQIMRFLKRLYVRRFCNHTNRSMKTLIYRNLVHRSKKELQASDAGNLLTRAISDADDCAEGMRKFTTEIFDTGIALLAYAGMLFFYDWRLTLIVLIFPPISYFIADHLKKIIQKAGAAFKETSARLSNATMDRAVNALTYRVFGTEDRMNERYEEELQRYERDSVRSSILVSALPPLYTAVSLFSVIFILYFGSRNVLGNGWSVWNIASFTTYLACYAKLSIKSGKVAKLFNSVQKAEVSWNRIRPYLCQPAASEEIPVHSAETLSVSHLTFAYEDGNAILSDLSFKAEPGMIIGVTGAVASGKSTLGKVFLPENSYEGSILYGNTEIRDMTDTERNAVFAYLGHDTELFSDSIRNNILSGHSSDPEPFTDAVRLHQDLSSMKDGIETSIGNGGVLVSGGQAQRIALARTLAHPHPVLILDDPFSALDRTTEKEIFTYLRTDCRDQIILLISHRLTCFPETDAVLYLEDGHAAFSTHTELMQHSASYQTLYALQEGGDHHEA